MVLFYSYGWVPLYSDVPAESSELSGFSTHLLKITSLHRAVLDLPEVYVTKVMSRLPLQETNSAVMFLLTAGGEPAPPELILAPQATSALLPLFPSAGRGQRIAGHDTPPLTRKRSLPDPLRSSLARHLRTNFASDGGCSSKPNDAPLHP